MGGSLNTYGQYQVTNSPSACFWDAGANWRTEETSMDMRRTDLLGENWKSAQNIRSCLTRQTVKKILLYLCHHKHKVRFRTRLLTKPRFSSCWDRRLLVQHWTSWQYGNTMEMIPPQKIPAIEQELNTLLELQFKGPETKMKSGNISSSWNMAHDRRWCLNMCVSLTWIRQLARRSLSYSCLWCGVCSQGGGRETQSADCLVASDSNAVQELCST